MPNQFVSVADSARTSKRQDLFERRQLFLEQKPAVRSDNSRSKITFAEIERSAAASHLESEKTTTRQIGAEAHHRSDREVDRLANDQAVQRVKDTRPNVANHGQRPSEQSADTPPSERRRLANERARALDATDKQAQQEERTSSLVGQSLGSSLAEIAVLAEQALKVHNGGRSVAADQPSGSGQVETVPVTASEALVSLDPAADAMAEMADLPEMTSKLGESTGEHTPDLLETGDSELSQLDGAAELLLSFEDGVRSATQSAKGAADGAANVFTDFAPNLVAANESLRNISKYADVPQHVANAAAGQLVETLIQEAVSMEDASSKRITLKLNPSELGQLTLHVGWENESLKAQIVASELTTSELLNRDRTTLLDVLQEHGLEFDEFDVSYGGQDAGGDSTTTDHPRLWNPEISSNQNSTPDDANVTPLDPKLFDSAGGVFNAVA